MLYYAKGSPDTAFTDRELEAAFQEGLDKVEAARGRPKRVLVLPPDITRVHSRAGILTRFAYDRYGSALTDILPALGTHKPMTSEEIREMFPGVPENLFRVHRWRTDVATLGEVPASFIEEVSEGKLSFPWPAQANRMVVEGGHDLILSPGQVVPHEVIGMANYNKNVFVGTGGAEGINKSHYLGAVYGMERIMGRAINPVRKVLNYAHDRFARHLPLVFAHTVVGRRADGSLAVQGLYIGDDLECFLKAAELSLKVNFTMLDKPLAKAVVYLDPKEFRSTWLGNKSVYRTRMALADGGELVVLAPGVKEFGEDPEIDRLIRKYGYSGTDRVVGLVEKEADLKASLSAAAHLIHGSSEGRFSITYAPGHLSREEVEGVGFRFADLGETLKRYDPARLMEGFNTLPDGEEIFYISNPAVGLWAYRGRFAS
ncbi:MAG TPA: lactate racemase domain-containing protein [Spirochaetia bacterium]|nr:lactate racemase domain-containing protein [Spirochaetales bacterium]HRY79265.1 lactate racemase domain-containing protein [Spirochaetia bacterium]